MLRRAGSVGWVGLVGTEVDGGGHDCVSRSLAWLGMARAQARREGRLCSVLPSQCTASVLWLRLAVAEARGGATLDVSGRTKERLHLTYTDDLAVLTLRTAGVAPQTAAAGLTD
jgi:hypothetical protein